MSFLNCWAVSRIAQVKKKSNLQPLVNHINQQYPTFLAWWTGGSGIGGSGRRGDGFAHVFTSFTKAVSRTLVHHFCTPVLNRNGTGSQPGSLGPLT